MNTEGWGTLFGVGVGPGDPELITFKAARVLAEVDTVFVPSSAEGDGASFVRAIVEPLGLPASKFRTVALRMSGDRREASEAYDRAADQIAGLLRAGRSAAWATEGDPMLYSTFLALRAALRGRAPEARVEVVPGVPSVHAAAARAGLPLARQGESLAIIPASYGIVRLPELLDEFSTVCLLKVRPAFEMLLDTLDGLDRPVEAVYLEWVGTPQERLVFDLESLRDEEIPYFSLVLLRADDDSREES